MELTQEYLKSILHYDPETGEFTWRTKKSRGVRVGAIAGAISLHRGSTYRRIGIDGRNYLSHRLAWLYVRGKCPDVIDHINGDGLDNRIANLRGCTSADNSANSKMPVTNTSGYKGVSWAAGKWAAYIQRNGKKRYLGRFDAPEEAHAAYCKAANEIFGGFANHGR